MLATRNLINRQNLQWLTVVVILMGLTACGKSLYFPRKYQKDKPFLFKNNIEFKEHKFTASEKTDLRQRLSGQLDDSSRVQVKDAFFILHFIDRPPVYDSNAAYQSARYMEYSMQHLGYFNARVDFCADTVKKHKQRRVTVTYTVQPGKPTLIDTNRYRLQANQELQELALNTSAFSPLQKNRPVTKAGVYAELSRLVQLYRNNGYYKFTGDELRMTGDTTIEALTALSNDPFEQLRLFQEARQKRDSPTIRLSLVLTKPKDSARLTKYFIRNIHIYPDFRAGDSVSSPAFLTRADTLGHVFKYHQPLFKESFLLRNLAIRQGEMYNQDNYYRTINNFSRIGVWQSVNIEVADVPGTNQVDLLVLLVPGKKFGFDANLESSYSINSNTTSLANVTVGNVLGVSGNLSLTNRNIGREAIRMTNAIRAGVELNLGSVQKNGLINSTELSYNNGIAIPRFVTPFRCINRRKLISNQTVINTNLAYTNRINLFNLQSVNLSLGYEWTNRPSRKHTLKLLNVEFTKLYNESDSFTRTVQQNPFLRSSFTTALVLGAAFNYASVYVNPKYRGKRQRTFKFNAEESGLLIGRLENVFPGDNFIKRDLRRFLKFDFDYNYTVNYAKSAFVLRSFLGIGIPITRLDTTLPFFKQFLAGGSNSMRGWPIRGLGPGAQPLAPYGGSSNSTLNDRTGDLQFELNVEYRADIAPIIPNSIMLKGALFADIGNIWNLKNTTPTRTEDITQFKLENLYKQLAVSAGAGLRVDFSFFLLRFDFGFRFKRPDIAKNSGWQFPSINFNNMFGSGARQRQWRYENFNFTIGINYPF